MGMSVLGRSRPSGHGPSLPCPCVLLAESLGSTPSSGPGCLGPEQRRGKEGEKAGKGPDPCRCPHCQLCGVTGVGEGKNGSTLVAVGFL